VLINRLNYRVVKRFDKNKMSSFVIRLISFYVAVFGGERYDEHRIPSADAGIFKKQSNKANSEGPLIRDQNGVYAFGLR
jgi:hypothetical protein